MKAETRKPLKLAEIAERIRAKLAEFEADPKTNTSAKGITRFWRSGAAASGRYVSVCYVSYQGRTNLPKDEAIAYMEWLEAGNVGKYHAFANQKAGKQ